MSAYEFRFSVTVLADSPQQAWERVHDATEALDALDFTGAALIEGPYPLDPAEEAA